MDRIRDFLDGFDASLLEAIWRYMSLPPARLGSALGFLGAFIVLCELTRIALAPEHVQSRLAHVLMCLLTFPIQSMTLAVVLVHAGRSYAGRGWINLAFAFGLYVVWYVAGQLTRLARPLSEGADLGFMSVGALITFPVGVIVALIT